MGSIKLEDVSSIELNLGNALYHPNSGITATASLLDILGPLNTNVKDDAS